MAKHIFFLFFLIGQLSFRPAYAKKATYIPLYWEKEISQALVSRDDYYESIGIDRLPVNFRNILTEENSGRLFELIQKNPDTGSPWYYFLLGIYRSYTSPTEAANQFNKAITIVKENPGMSWVLFCEFRQAGQLNWAKTCLKQLEYLFLTSGAQSAPVISQQLLAFAMEEKRTVAEPLIDYYEWSKRFERYAFWQTFVQGTRSLPGNFLSFLKYWAECLRILSLSWELQLVFLRTIYYWLRFAVIIFIAATFLISFIKAIPFALHPVTELFPKPIPSRLRLALSIIIILSTASLGIIPFVLFNSVILWKYLDRFKKILLAVSVAFLTLSPVDARIRDVFYTALNPRSSVGLYNRAINEGYSTELERVILSMSSERPGDYLLNLSSAILGLKSDDLASAEKNILKAENLSPSDPVILCTAGNVFFSSGDYEKASNYYTKSLNLFPEDETSCFNLGQTKLSSMNIVHGSELIAKSTKMNSRLINNFIGKNAYHFVNSWPSNRQYIQPDYKPLYFWTEILPDYSGSWDGARMFWAASFWGFSPVYFLLIAPLFFTILLFVYSKGEKKHKVKTVFICRLCGLPICRKCKVGKICQECLKLTYRINSEMQNQNIEKLLAKRRSTFLLASKTLLNIFFPGAGTLHAEIEGSPATIIKLIITSLIYSSYLAVFSFSFSYPFWVVSDPFYVLLGCLAVYNMFFIIDSLRKAYREIQIKESSSVS